MRNTRTIAIIAILSALVLSSCANTIRGIGRCEQRGMTSSGFYEVDTGEHTSWTVQLLDNAITEGAPQ